MDMQMPVMDGVTATVEIRKLAQFKELPIIAMTANAMQQDRQRCMDAGMNDYLAKPIEPDELWAVLSRWIKPDPGRSAREHSGASGAVPPGQAATTATVDIPGNIEGLDVSAALRHVAGNAATLLSLLRRFVKKQKTAAQEIRSALEGADWASAERLAHTLKGVAGTLGAQGLQVSARELELAIRERQPTERIHQQLDRLAAALGALICELEAKLPADKEITAPVAVDAARLQAVVAELSTLLAHDDFGAGELFSANADLLRAAFPAAFGRIAQGIENFDFSAAKAALDGAYQSIGTNLG